MVANGRAADERVAAPTLAAFHRLEQEARPVADQGQKGGHRRHGVGDHLAPDRHDPVGGGQLGKRRQIGDHRRRLDARARPRPRWAWPALGHLGCPSRGGPVVRVVTRVVGRPRGVERPARSLGKRPVEARALAGVTAPRPCWSTSTTTVSPSQSSRTSRTYWRSPEVSPFCQYSLPATAPEPRSTAREGPAERLRVHEPDHQHHAVVRVLDRRRARGSLWRSPRRPGRRRRPRGVRPGAPGSSGPAARGRGHRRGPGSLALRGRAPSRRRSARRPPRGCRARARSRTRRPGPRPRSGPRG